MSLVTRMLNVAIVFAAIAAVTQTAMATPTGLTPDAGSTSLLLGLACGGLAAVRRFSR